MKRKAISALLILFMIGALLAPMGAKPLEAAAATSFTIRTSMPKLNDKNAKFYYSDLNRFWKAGRLAPDFKYYKGIMDDGRTGGYVWGNCTWWAYSRASEVIGEPLNPNLRGNAGEWWSCNKKGNYYPYGSTPKAGAIVVYKTHVAFVEKVVNGQIYVSESGWQTRTYGPSSTDDFFFHYGKPWSSNGTPQGYIYVTDKKPASVKTKAASYSVKVSVSDLRMRSGPGTGYSNMGYIKKGTYKLKAVTTDGEWGQLSSNGYWICLEYTTKVVPKSSNNNLKALSVSGYSISPAFKATETSYSLTVPSNVSSVTIKATKANSKAVVSGTGKISLATGTNTRSVKVKAENGAVKTYTIKITRSKETKVKVSVTDLNMRSGPGTGYSSKGKLKAGTYAIVQTKNGWGKLKTNGYWISLAYTKAATSSTAAATAGAYKVKVKVTSLNMRTGPGTSYKSKGKLKKGTYTISSTKNGWGKLKTNGYWIKLSYTTKVSSTTAAKTYKVKVKVTELNMRTGPGTSYKSKGKLKKGTYTISSTKNGWGKVKSNGYWIKLSYTTKV
ncbi:CHAP domain-containing protein [bacterium 210820-DFI.6.37]|nr:CHAP domain-containing protein [bacterium 210820-DFI.6.37]